MIFFSVARKEAYENKTFKRMKLKSIQFSSELDRHHSPHQCTTHQSPLLKSVQTDDWKLIQRVKKLRKV